MVNLLLWYGICAILITGMTLLSTKLKFSRNTVFMIMAVVSFLSEAEKIVTHMEKTYMGNGEFAGYFIAPPALPFHLCSLLIFVFFYLALSKNEERKTKILQFVVPVGFLGGFLGVAFASSGTSFVKLDTYQSFLYHAFVVWFALHFMIKREVDLGKKQLFTNFGILFALSIVVLWINGILRVNTLVDSRYVNFMFLAKPPMSGLPLINLKHGWPAYYCHLMFVGSVLLTLVHSPFLVIECKTASKREVPEAE